MTNIKKVLVAAVVGTAAAAFKEDFSEPIQTCPKGYDFNGKECTRTRIVEPRQSCPKGFQQDKRGCVATQSVRAEPVCPDGYQGQQSGGKGKHHSGGLTCIRSEETDPIPSCPPGFEDTGKGCEQVAKATLSVTKVPRITECSLEYDCPPGFMNDGKECIGEVLSEKVVTQEVITEECPTSSQCPPGFSPVDGGAKSGGGGKGGDLLCEKTEVRAKLERHVREVQECEVDVQCPKGSTPSGDKDGSCLLQQTTEKLVQRVSNTQQCDPAPFCPAGAVDSGKGCEVQRTVQKVAVQPNTKNSVPMEYQCQDGSQPDEKSGLCSTSRAVDPITTVSVETVPCDTDVVCPKGYTQEGGDGKKGGQCVLHDRQPAVNRPVTEVVPCDTQYVCPPGAMDNGEGECLITQSVPYTTTYEEVVVECPTYQTCPPGSKDLGNGNCIVQNSVPPEQDCQQIPIPSKGGFDSDVKGKQQEVEYELQCTEICPKGTEPAGKGVCVSQEQVPSTLSCAAGCSSGSGKGGSGGKGKSGECTTVERRSVQECPKGYTDSGKGCDRHDVVPQIGSCPKGCNSGSGKGGSGGKGKSGECTRSETTYVSECPKGYNLVEDAKGASTGKGKGPQAFCESNITTEPLEVCPQECQRSSGKGKHGKGKGFIDQGCFRVETHPSVQCPKGYTEAPSNKGKGGVTCISEAQVPPVPYCPKGSTPTKDGQCVQAITQTEFECPLGSEDVGKAGCVERVSVPYQYACPKDCQEAKQHGKKGGKGELPLCFSLESSIVESCPKGYEDEGKQCVMTRQVPPTSFCPKDCQQSGGKHGKKGKGMGDACFRTTSTSVFECPKGFEDNGKECVATVTSGPSAACPKGCQETKSGCISTTVVPTSACPKGSEDTGKGCRTVRSQAPIPVCPKGCQQSGGKHGKKGKGTSSCFQIDYEEVQTCPKGYQGKGGKGSSDCESNDVRPYRYDCPKGYNPITDGKGKHSSGQIIGCRRIDIAPADVTCPKGTEPVGSGGKGILKGSAGAESILCQSREYVDPDVSCEKGGVLTDAGCEITDVADPIVSVPKGKGAPPPPPTKF